MNLPTESQNELMKKFKIHRALWSYPGKGAHIVLPSGNHSNYLFDGSRVISYPYLLSDICYWLARELRTVYKNSITDVRWIVGVGLESIKIADGVARHLFDFLDLTIRASYAEVGVDGQIVVDPAFAPEKGDHCVLVESTVIGDSYMCADQIRARGGIVFPVRLAIINMSGNDRLPDGDKIISVISKSPKIWAPEECPFCAEGSVAIEDPAKYENWQILMAN